MSQLSNRGHTTRPPNADQRRYLLIQWIDERPAHDGLTAREIADVSGLYDHIQHGRADRCHDDRSTRPGPPGGPR